MCAQNIREKVTCKILKTILTYIGIAYNLNTTLNYLFTLFRSLLLIKFHKSLLQRKFNVNSQIFRKKIL